MAEISNEKLSLNEEFASFLKSSKLANAQETFEVTYEIVTKEMNLWDTQASGRKRPEKIDKLYKALHSVRPTSVESERAFSCMGLFTRRLRGNLSDETLNALVFMKHFLRKNE